MASKINVGDRFRLTGKFLRSTGQTRGSAGLSVWTRVACSCLMCARGEWIASNEAGSAEVYPDLPPEEIPPRHFAIANVCRVGTVDARNVS